MISQKRTEIHKTKIGYGFGLGFGKLKFDVTNAMQFEIQHAHGKFTISTFYHVRRQWARVMVGSSDPKSFVRDTGSTTRMVQRCA